MDTMTLEERRAAIREAFDKIRADFEAHPDCDLVCLLLGWNIAITDEDDISMDMSGSLMGALPAQVALLNAGLQRTITRLAEREAALIEGDPQ